MMSKDKFVCPLGDCSHSYYKWERLQRHLMAKHTGLPYTSSAATPTSNEVTNRKTLHPVAPVIPTTSAPKRKRRRRQREQPTAQHHTQVTMQPDEPANPDPVPIASFTPREVIDIRSPSPAPIQGSPQTPKQIYNPASVAQCKDNQALRKTPTWVTRPPSIPVEEPPEIELDEINEIDSVHSAADVPTPRGSLPSTWDNSPFNDLSSLLQRNCLCPQDTAMAHGTLQQAPPAELTSQVGPRQLSFALSDDELQADPAPYAPVLLETTPVPTTDGGPSQHIEQRRHQNAFAPFAAFALTPPPAGSLKRGKRGAGWIDSIDEDQALLAAAECPASQEVEAGKSPDDQAKVAENDPAGGAAADEVLPSEKTPDRRLKSWGGTMRAESSFASVAAHSAIRDSGKPRVPSASASVVGDHLNFTNAHDRHPGNNHGPYECSDRSAAIARALGDLLVALWPCCHAHSARCTGCSSSTAVPAPSPSGRLGVATPSTPRKERLYKHDIAFPPTPVSPTVQGEPVLGHAGFADETAATVIGDLVRAVCVE